MALRENADAKTTQEKLHWRARSDGSWCVDESRLSLLLLREKRGGCGLGGGGECRRGIYEDMAASELPRVGSTLDLTPASSCRPISSGYQCLFSFLAGPMAIRIELEVECKMR